MFWRRAAIVSFALCSIPLFSVGIGFGNVRDPDHFLTLGFGVVALAGFATVVFLMPVVKCVGIEGRGITLKVRHPQYIEADRHDMHG